MNETAIEAQGIAPLSAVVDELRIKFAVTGPGSNATMGDTSLGDALLYLSQLGINAFAEVGAANDILDPVNGRVEVLLGPAASGQEAAAEEERRDVKSLRAASYAQVLQALLPGNMTGQQSARLETGVTDLEDAIAGITPKMKIEELSSVASRLSLDEVAKLSPGLGYDRIIKALAPAPDAVGNVTVVHPSFLGNLSEMVSTAPRDIVQAYLVVKVVGSFLQDVKLPSLEPLKQLAEVSIPPADRPGHLRTNPRDSGSELASHTAALATVRRPRQDDMGPESPLRGRHAAAGVQEGGRRDDGGPPRAVYPIRRWRPLGVGRRQGKGGCQGEEHVRGDRLSIVVAEQRRR